MKPLHFLLLSAAAAALFLLFPQIDMAVARALSDPRASFPFPLRDWAPVAVLHDYVPWISRSVAIAVVLAALVWAVPGLKRFRLKGAAIAYIALSLAIGPGVITNGLLKENSGRARPAQVIEFGGPKQFSGALRPAKQCDTNCSFVSGHAATGFFLVSFALLMAPGMRRTLAIGGAVAAGGVFGLARMAEGGHWLSDIVFAGLINIAVAWILYRLVVARDDVAAAFVRVAAHRAVKRHAAIFAVVAAIVALCIAYVDLPTARFVAQAPPEMHVWFRDVASIGESTAWYVITGLGFALMWFVGGRMAEPQSRRDMFKAWSILPLYLCASMAVSGAVGLVLKVVFGRVRPGLFLRTGDSDFHWFSLTAKYMSFPSGHANTIAALMVGLGFIFPRWRWAFLLIAAAALIARVAEYQHYVSDVLFGAWLGTVAAIWVKSVFERSGLDLAAARAGRFAPRAAATWRERLGF